MTDRKKNTSRNQTAAVKARSSSGEPSKSVSAPAKEERREPAKKAPAREERREPKQEGRTAVRQKSKGTSGFGARLRNNALGRFIYEAYYELRHKVTWPTPKQARTMVIAVVVLSIVIGGIIALADFGLQQLFLLIIGAR